MARQKAVRHTRKPFFRHLPDWVYDQPAWVSDDPHRRDRLSMGDRWALHVIAGQCSQKPDGDGLRRGCRCGPKLWAKLGCSKSGFLAVLSKLVRLGFVVRFG